MKNRIFLLIGFLVALTAIRFWLGANLELSPLEAYHYLWAQHPGISYYSEGPGIAIAVLAGTSVLGPTELGVRLLSPVIAVATSILVYLLASKLSRERVAFWAVIGLNFLPLFNLQSILITVDSLSVFFWVAAVYTFALAIERSPRFSIFWPLTGIIVGLGFLCRYENALALLSIVIFILVVPKYRRELLRPNLYVLLVCFTLFLAPPIVWNIQHEWLGLEQISPQAILNLFFKIRISHLSESLETQLLLYSPLILIALAIGLLGSIGKAFQNSRICLLLTFTWPPVLLYLIKALHEFGDPTLLGPAIVILGIVATYFWIGAAKNRKLVAGICIAAIAFSGIQACLIVDTNLVRSLGVPVPETLDAISSSHGWKTIAETIDKFRTDFEHKLGAKVFLIGNDYQTSSILSFYLPDKRIEAPDDPPVFIPESQDIQNEFSFWPRYDEFAPPDPSAKRDTTFSEEEGVNRFINRTALYITNQPEAAPPQNLQSAFTRCELLKVYELERKDLPFRQIRIFACYQYQTLPL
jgi:4-amino-4-deoxy-L-arabinose transferase-like glycosyltransferase